MNACLRCQLSDPHTAIMHPVARYGVKPNDDRRGKLVADSSHALRACGLSERQILDAALTVAYFSFVNRLVLLLGIEPEGDYQRTCGSGPHAG